MTRLACLAAFFTFGPTSLFGLGIYQYNSDLDRFDSFPGTDNPSFLYDDYDWSGVGWRDNDPQFSVTLITDRHIIGAAHAMTTAGADITFKGSDGILYTYEVANTTVLTQEVDGVVYDTDLYIAELTTDVDASISHYNYADFEIGDEIGYRVLMYGRDKRVGQQTIDDRFLINVGTEMDPVITYALQSTYASIADIDQRQQYDSRFQPGDSSSPTFLIVDEELVLLGVHSAVTGSDPVETIMNYDSSVLDYADQINDIIAPSGQTFESTTVVPEPATAALLAGAGLLLALRRRKF